MDSIKYKARLSYMPGPLPQVESKEVDPQFFQSSAPYMPLYDQELGGNVVEHLSYPTLEPPRIVEKSQNQIETVATEVTEDNKEANLKKLVKTAKTKIMKTVKILRVMFILKIVGVIVAGFALLGEDPIAPGAIPCMLLLTFATLSFGRTICIGKKSAKKMKHKFVGKSLKMVICHYCCYYLALFLACMIIFDIIHFNAHIQTITHEIKLRDPATSPQMTGRPPRSEPIVLTMNNQQSFPQFSPNEIFGDYIVVTVTEQKLGQNQIVSNTEISSSNAFEGLPEIDQELADIIKMFEQQLDDMQIQTQSWFDESFEMMWTEEEPILDGLRNLREKDHGKNKKHHGKDKKHKNKHGKKDKKGKKHHKKHEEVPEPAIVDFHNKEHVPVSQGKLSVTILKI